MDSFFILHYQRYLLILENIHFLKCMYKTRRVTNVCDLCFLLSLREKNSSLPSSFLFSFEVLLCGILYGIISLKGSAD